MKKNKLFFFDRLFLAFYLHISKILLCFAVNKQTYWIMTLLDILDPDVTLIVGNMLADGWTLKRVSFVRGYLRVGYGRMLYTYNRKGYDHVDIYVPNRRTRPLSNRYHAVVRLVKPVDLPF